MLARHNQIGVKLYSDIMPLYNVHYSETPKISFHSRHLHQAEARYLPD